MRNIILYSIILSIFVSCNSVQTERSDESIETNDSQSSVKQNSSKEVLTKTNHINETVKLRSYPLQVLEKKYGLEVILKAIHSIEEYRTILVGNDQEWYLNLDTRIKKLNSPKRKMLIHRLDSMIISKGASEKKEILERIKWWCITDGIIEVAFYKEENIPYFFPELVFEIEQTKHLVEKYFAVKEQYWGSLSESQIDELRFSVPNYVSKLPIKERFLFYSKYFEICSNKLK